LGDSLCCERKTEKEREREREGFEMSNPGKRSVPNGAPAFSNLPQPRGAAKNNMLVEILGVKAWKPRVRENFGRDK